MMDFPGICGVRNGKERQTEVMRIQEFLGKPGAWGSLGVSMSHEQEEGHFSKEHLSSF